MLYKLIDEFNKNRAKTVAASVINILRKSEPLGTEFKSMGCSETGKIN
jgi:hypothetical protein